MNPSNKATPMTKDETMLFVQLVAANPIINNKATNATNNKMKDQAWQSLAVDFNSSVSSSRRTPAQLRLKWDNLKKSARKRCAIMRSSCNKTGGGKVYFPPDEVLDKVASLLGSTCSGFSVDFGDDSTIQAGFDLVLGEVDNLELNFSGDGLGIGDGICGEGADEREVLKETQICETTIPSPKHKNFFFSKASGSGIIAKRKQKMEEEKCKARIFRENALAEYLMAKKRKVELENEEKEIVISKLKLELENARLQQKYLNLID